MGNYDEALLNYENSLKANPEDALAMFDYGKLLARVKNYKEKFPKSVFISFAEQKLKELKEEKHLKSD
jgi:hypothetical protein